MSEQHPNLVLIQSFFTAYAENDLEAMRQILSPDIDWVIPGRNPT
jgi:ketosteroid isomerase-like protein